MHTHPHSAGFGRRNIEPFSESRNSPKESWPIDRGASTHPRNNANSLTGLTSSAGTLPDITGKSTAAGLPSSPIVHAADFGNPLCLPGGWPGATPDLSGVIAICDRGSNGRVEKSQVVADAGAAGFVLINDEANDTSLLGDEYVIPGVFISNTDGAALKAWLDNGATDHTAAIAGTTAHLRGAAVENPRLRGGPAALGPLVLQWGPF